MQLAPCFSALQSDLIAQLKAVDLAATPFNHLTRALIAQSVLI